jgi:small subunit ribosomal protein S9
MSSLLESSLTTSRYRRVTHLLDQLSEYQRMASSSGCYDLGNNISSILELFQKESVEDLMVRKKRRPVPIDEYGRSYTVGKRKTSAARVWIIRVQSNDKDPEPTLVAQNDADIADELLDLNSPTKASPESNGPSEIPTTTVLINNIPLAEYFRVPADRERVIRPLKLAGVLGAYNVFSLVRGGGTSGQSGAVAHGIAKGLLAHEPQVEAILRRGKPLSLVLSHRTSLTILQLNW